MQDDLKSFFGDDSAVLFDIEQACVEVHYNNNELILSKEDDDNTVYFILSGSVKAVLYSQDGEETWLDEFKKGALFGEMPALGSSLRTATIMASSPVRVATIQAQKFLQLMEKHGSIGIKVDGTLTERIEHTTRRMFELSAVSAKGRVYSELLRLAAISDDKLTIENLPAYTVFAKRINTTRETVSRTMNKLSQNGFIKKEGNTLKIISLKELENITL